MKKLILLPLVIFCLLPFIGKAQDVMILRFKADSLKVKIIEIGTDEIKYKLWPVEESMPIMVENKDRVKRIILANGTVMRFSENEFMNANNYSNQRKMAVKIDMFSFLYGSTSVAFEQSIEPGRSWEVGVGFIGMGSNLNNGGDYNSRSGAFFKGGYKFINQPDYYLKGMRYAHVMKGAYIRPELAVNFYNTIVTGTSNSSSFNTTTNMYDIVTENRETKYRNSAFAFLLNFGKQWVFSDIFLVDAFAGIGLGIGDEKKVSSTITSKTTSSSLYNPYYYGSGSYYDYNYYNPSGTGFATSMDGKVFLAGSCGLKLGILIGAKKMD